MGRGRVIRLAAVAAAVAGVVAVPPPPTAAAAAGTSGVVAVSADATVDAAAPHTNAGAARRLVVSSTPARRAYLRLRVSGLSAPPRRVLLQVYVLAGGSSRLRVASSPARWSERTITWRTAPAPGPTVMSTGAVGARRWLSIDVTRVVHGNGDHALTLASSGRAVVSLAAREAGAAHAPRLVVTPVPWVSATGPVRAAFYYPWFPEAWSQQGMDPFTHYHPTLGYYDGSGAAVVRAQIGAMRYAGLRAGIASWWGQGSRTDTRIPTLLAAAAGTGFAWTLYYEPESQGDPAPDRISRDLAYLWAHYAGNAAYLHVAGRPVLFVYADAGDGCAMVDRWRQADPARRFYVVLKVFAGYRSCSAQPDGWHQYGPASPADGQGTYSYSISPGFWKANQTAPRLARDVARFTQDAQAMVASGARWQLVTTFNEWGEGTAVESAQEWSSSSGYGAYLDALHAVLG